MPLHADISNNKEVLETNKQNEEEKKKRKSYIHLPSGLPSFLSFQLERRKEVNGRL